MNSTQTSPNHVTFSSKNFVSIDEREFEIVERKGIGHPDTLADGLAETISNEYSKYCLKNFGVILHHNVDKVAVQGGQVDIDFGRGTMSIPAKVILNGRMSDSFGDKKIDTLKFQNSIAEKYIKKILPHIDSQKWLEFINLTNTYSHNPHWYHPRNLQDLPDHQKPHANDTSACVGYWPLSIVESLILNLEKYFYRKNDQPKFAFIGQDIKFMAVREKHHINITSCIPFISTETPSQKFYNIQSSKIIKDLENIALKTLPRDYTFEIIMNTADTPDDHYLLLTGSCIEAGEEGVVGRGNKTRGTISSVRPFSMEAANGKNPVYHVGKVLTIVADSLSKKIAEKFNCECNVYITTKNKDDLFHPNRIIVETSETIDEKIGLEYVNKHLRYPKWTVAIITKGLLVPKPGRGNTFTI